MARYRRVYRPTMAHRHHRDRRREQGGTPNPADPVIAAAFGKPVPGLAQWRRGHAVKTAMRWCEALKLAKSVQHFGRTGTGTGDKRLWDPSKLHVYACQEGPAVGVLGPLHWHTGHDGPR